MTEARTQGAAIYDDGRLAHPLEWRQENMELVSKTPGAWSVGADGVLTVVTNVAGTLKRVRISPPADTSVDTFIASAR